MSQPEPLISPIKLMQLEAILSVILSGAHYLKKPFEDVSAQAIKDAYSSAKEYLVKKLSGNSAALQALENATDKPESPGRKAVLLEETEELELPADSKLVKLVGELAKLVPNHRTEIHQNATVSGRGHKVLMAAGNIVNTEKIVKKNKITPDERHISAAQKKKLKPVIDDLAYRLAGDDGEPKFGAVYNMLETRYDVVSYLLIKREDFEDALGFLKQQRAIKRSRLRSRDPKAYEGDFIKKIHTCRSHLGWDKPQLYQFALERLALKKPITSTKQLGSIQLKTLSEFMQREAAKVS